MTEDEPVIEVPIRLIKKLPHAMACTWHRWDTAPLPLRRAQAEPACSCAVGAVQRLLPPPTIDDRPVGTLLSLPDATGAWATYRICAPGHLERTTTHERFPFEALDTSELREVRLPYEHDRYKRCDHDRNQHGFDRVDGQWRCTATGLRNGCGCSTFVDEEGAP